MKPYLIIQAARDLLYRALPIDSDPLADFARDCWRDRKHPINLAAIPAYPDDSPHHRMYERRVGPEATIRLPICGRPSVPVPFLLVALSAITFVLAVLCSLTFAYHVGHPGPFCEAVQQP